MKIAGIYPFNTTIENFVSKYGDLFEEVQQVITNVNASTLKTKASEEATRNYEMLYSPKSLNKHFKIEFGKFGWAPLKVMCDYSTDFYVPGYSPPPMKGAPSREMDFLKNGLGIEVQFGKYAFMVYNVAAKMTIFRKLGHIKAGIEIVPVHRMIQNMSTGVSYFEQFVWDLENRGISDIDTPVLVLGVIPDELFNIEEN